MGQRICSNDNKKCVTNNKVWSSINVLYVQFRFVACYMFWVDEKTKNRFVSRGQNLWMNLQMFPLYNCQTNKVQSRIQCASFGFLYVPIFVWLMPVLSHSCLVVSVLLLLWLYKFYGIGWIGENKDRTDRMIQCQRRWLWMLALNVVVLHTPRNETTRKKYTHWIRHTIKNVKFRNFERKECSIQLN